MLPFWVRASKEILGREEGLGPVWQLSDRWASELGKEAEGDLSISGLLGTKAHLLCPLRLHFIR